MTDIKSLNYDELVTYMAGLGEKKFRASQLYQWMHEKLADSFDECTNLSNALRQKLKETSEYVCLEPVRVQHSKLDGTEKYLFRLSDGNYVESVLMKYHHGNSVCISSQVGCRMGCRFCASTLNGKVRDLRPSEMLDQIYRIQKITGERVSNVVVMGSGEPMDNYDNLIKFIELLNDERGLNISQRNITVSSCGIVPKLKELADLKLQITLAISLHAPNDELRKTMMPIANKYSIEEIMDVCRYYIECTGRRISFEYSLVKGVNDSMECAKQLIELVKGMNCHINLIPVNSIKERDYKQTGKDEVYAFKNKLEKNGINVTIRREMGRDIDGACGQLRNNQDYIYTSVDRVGCLPNLFIVADGMGGHKAGDIASRFTVETIKTLIEQSQGKDAISIINDSVKMVNGLLLQKASESEDYYGMGTTLVIATIFDNVLRVANVGDSRLYVIDDNDITQITRDHSLVEEMVLAGQLSKSEARTHARKNVITRAIGVEEQVEPEMFSIDLKENSKVLMCSDGLTNMLEDAEILSIVRNNADIEDAARMLIDRANENGGKDNISVIIVEL